MKNYSIGVLETPVWSNTSGGLRNGISTGSQMNGLDAVGQERPREAANSPNRHAWSTFWQRHLRQESHTRRGMHHKRIHQMCLKLFSICLPNNAVQTVLNFRFFTVSSWIRIQEFFERFKENIQRRKFISCQQWRTIWIRPKCFLWKLHHQFEHLCACIMPRCILCIQDPSPVDQDSHLFIVWYRGMASLYGIAIDYRSLHHTPHWSIDVRRRLYFLLLFSSYQTEASLLS